MPVTTTRKERGSALEKSLLILEAIVDQPQAIGLPDLTMRVGLPRQTVHRVLQQLEENGLIIRDVERDRFSIGPRLYHLSLASLYSNNQGAPIRAVLQELVDDIQETCNMGVLNGIDFLYLERIECAWSLRVHLQAGSRVPAYCTSGGKALLAYLPAEERAALLKPVTLKAFTEKTITDPDVLEVECSKIRKRGYAINNEEYSVGILGIAVPVLDPNGRALSALALHAPVARMPEAEARRHIDKLRAAADRLADVWHASAGGELAA